MSSTSRPDSLDDCKISVNAPSQTQTQRSNGIGTDHARIEDMGADKLCDGLSAMACFEQLQSKLQTILERMQHLEMEMKMEMWNQRVRLFNKTAYLRGDNIRPLRVLCAPGIIALAPPAKFQFPDNVWHFWILPLKHLLALLQFYEIDGWRASDLNPTYHDGSNHRGSHSDSHSMHTAAVDAFRDDALRALARELGMDYDRVATEMRVAQPAMDVAQQGTGRKRSRTAPGIAQPRKKTRRCEIQALINTTDQLMQIKVGDVTEVTLEDSASPSDATRTKLGWEATAESSSKAERRKIDASSPHHDCMSLHGSSNNSTTTSMVLSGSKRSLMKRHAFPPSSDTEEDNDEDAEAAVALARRAL
ncbi:hypothetical protein LTR81_028004, partial [Elasticomyces elasticus]